MSKAQKHINEYAELRRVELGIRYLDQKYRKAHEWIPRLPAEAPGLEPEQALTNIRNRLAELRHKRRDLMESHLSRRMERAHQVPDLSRSLAIRAVPHKEWTHVCSAGSPGSIQLAYPRPLDPGEQFQMTEGTIGKRILEQIESAQAAPTRIEGTVTASGFKEYVWGPKLEDDTQEWHVILPLGTGSPDDFVGATGLQFVNEIEVFPEPLGDPLDGVGWGGLLQYSLPEAPWDGAVQWCIGQRYEIKYIRSDADYGFFGIASPCRQCPAGDDFPALDDYVDAVSLEDVYCSIWVEGESFNAGPFNVKDSFVGGFPVAKGQKPRIYVGIDVAILATDGTTVIGDPSFAYHSSPGGPGLSYTFVRI